MTRDHAAGTLHVVATPLGNLGDISSRAVKVLGEADLVLAEDTRRTGMLFKRLGISSHGFMSLHEHNEQARLSRIIEVLESGRDAALVSDAGTPLLSDPGFRLVRACREAGLNVSPVPGPSAMICALSACGLPPQPFVFLGFLPRSGAEKKRALAPYAEISASIVFYERKSRLMDSLELAREVLGPREVCLARELTKEHEQFTLSTLDDIAALEPTLRGEFTVVVGPPAPVGTTDEDRAEAVAREECALGGKPREIVRRVSARLEGWASSQVYDLVSRVRRDHDPDHDPDQDNPQPFSGNSR